jgi:hypothetical protein
MADVDVYRVHISARQCLAPISKVAMKPVEVKEV